jgi:hypothetical protein
MLADGCPTPRKDQMPCQARPTKSGFCLAHDPDLAQKRQQARVKGGQGKSWAFRAQKLLSPDLQTLNSILAGAIGAVVKGTIAPTQGSAIAALASCKIRLRETALRMAEQGELKDRILKLEERLSEINTSGRTNGAVTRRSVWWAPGSMPAHPEFSGARIALP